MFAVSIQRYYPARPLQCFRIVPFRSHVRDACERIPGSPASSAASDRVRQVARYEGRDRRGRYLIGGGLPVVERVSLWYPWRQRHEEELGETSYVRLVKRTYLV